MGSLGAIYNQPETICPFEPSMAIHRLVFWRLRRTKEKTTLLS